MRSTPEGIAAQAVAATLSQRIPPAQYLGFLQQFAVPHASLRDRPGPRGKRFSLV